MALVEKHIRQFFRVYQPKEQTTFFQTLDLGLLMYKLGFVEVKNDNKCLSHARSCRQDIHA